MRARFLALVCVVLAATACEGRVTVESTDGSDGLHRSLLGGVDTFTVDGAWCVKWKHGYAGGLQCDFSERVRP